MSEAEDFSAHEMEYTIEAVARITRLPEEEIIVFTRAGFVSPLPSGNQADLLFDDEAIHQLRRLAYLLTQYEMNRDGLKMVSTLLGELEQLRQEVRFLREK